MLSVLAVVRSPIAAIPLPTLVMATVPPPLCTYLLIRSILGFIRWHKQRKEDANDRTS